MFQPRNLEIRGRRIYHPSFSNSKRSIQTFRLATNYEKMNVTYLLGNAVNLFLSLIVSIEDRDRFNALFRHAF